MNRVLQVVTASLFPCLLAAQTNAGIARHIQWGPSTPATCSPNTGDIWFITSTATPEYCSATNTWSPFSGVSSVGGGNLTANHIVIGGGSQTIQVSSAIIDNSGNMTTNSVTTGSGAPTCTSSGTGGYYCIGEGSAPNVVASASVVYADSVAHALFSSLNNGSFFRIPQAIASGQTAMATGSISANTCTSSTTATATGAATTDVPSAGYASDPTGVTGYGGGTSGGITIRMWVTLNTMNFKQCNETGSPITPGAISVNWVVIR